MTAWSRGTAMLLAVGSAGLVACGASGGGTAAGAPGSTAPTATSPTSTPPTSTLPMPSVPPPNLPVRLTGTVEEGVEPHCLQLVARGTSYLLLGLGQRLRVGQRVSVLGSVRRDLRTNCQQGVPLHVLAVQPAAPAQPPPRVPTGRMPGPPGPYTGD